VPRQTCLCPNPSYEVYDKVTGTCVGLAGSSCALKSGSNNSKCIKTASCVPLGNSTTAGVCKCKEGYIATSNGTCELGYQSHCNYTTRYYRESCFQEAGFVCIEGKCECPDALTYYDKNLRRCVSPLGVACRKALDCGNNAHCVICTGHPENNRLFKTCTCKPGYTEQTNGSCG